MRVVVDTNVLVSGLLKTGTPPSQVIAEVLSGRLIALHDDRIVAEYEEVLARPKFKFPPQLVRDILDSIIGDGERVSNAVFKGQLPDPDDQPFADVAFSGGADVLVTGNGAHFPVGRAIRVVTPRELVEILGKMELARSLGEDENAALAWPEEFTVATTCKKCGTTRRQQLLNLTPMIEPQQVPGGCAEPNANQPDGRCGGEIWSYDDNELGRRVAKSRGIPVGGP